jgi:hypothetical protein
MALRESDPRGDVIAGAYRVRDRQLVLMVGPGWHSRPADARREMVSALWRDWQRMDGPAAGAGGMRFEDRAKNRVGEVTHAGVVRLHDAGLPGAPLVPSPLEASARIARLPPPAVRAPGPRNVRLKAPDDPGGGGLG